MSLDIDRPVNRASSSWRIADSALIAVQTGHDPIAVADAGPALDEVQLKSADLVGGCRIGRTLQPNSEPLATVNVAALRVLVELARCHVFDHTLTQRTDSVSLAHGELLPE